MTFRYYEDPGYFLDSAEVKPSRETKNLIRDNIKSNKPEAGKALKSMALGGIVGGTVGGLSIAALSKLLGHGHYSPLMPTALGITLGVPAGFQAGLLAGGEAYRGKKDVEAGKVQISRIPDRYFYKPLEPVTGDSVKLSGILNTARKYPRALGTVAGGVLGGALGYGGGRLYYSQKAFDDLTPQQKSLLARNIAKKTALLGASAGLMLGGPITRELKDRFGERTYSRDGYHSYTPKVDVHDPKFSDFIDKATTKKEVHKKYRELAFKLHPDRVINDDVLRKANERKLADLNAFYDNLQRHPEYQKLAHLKYIHPLSFFNELESML